MTKANPPATPATIRTETLYRTATIERAAAEDGKADDRTVALAFSSESPVDRWFGQEILDHAPASVRLDFFKSGSAPLLLDHDPRRQIGVIQQASIGSDRKGRATVRLGKSALADEILTDLRDGIRRNVSVGYRVHRLLLEDETEGQETYRAVDWEPMEASIVAIPADVSVGVGRQAELPLVGNAPDGAAGRVHPTIIERRSPMTTETKTQPETPANREPPPPPAAPVNIDAVRKQELARMQGIMALGTRLGFAKEAEKAVADGASLDEFRAHVIERLPAQKPFTPKPPESADIGMSDREAQQFSFCRAIMGMVGARTNNKTLLDLAAFEREASAAASKKMGREPQGIFVPDDVLRRALVPDLGLSRREMAQRDLVVGTTTAGGHTVATDLLASSFIDLLRNRGIIPQLGATYLTGLQGNVAIPRHTGAATAYWVAENSNITSESQQAFDQVTMSPKTLGAYTDFSRQLLLQSSLDVEGLVRSDLTKVLALEIDSKALYGTGSSNTPTGIKSQSGINRATFAAPVTASTGPTWDEMVYMETQLATDNADAGNLGYAIRPNMRGYFKTKVKFASTGVTIWEPGNTVNGYKVGVSNQVTSNDAFFGNWSDLIVGLWGGLDLMLDPYAGALAGTVRVIALQSIDLAIRHPESFCYASNQASEG